MSAETRPNKPNLPNYRLPIVARDSEMEAINPKNAQVQLVARDPPNGLAYWFTQQAIMRQLIKAQPTDLQLVDL